MTSTSASDGVGPGGSWDYAGPGATYFDGRTSTAHAVAMAVRDGVLILRSDEVSRREPLAAVQVDDPLGATPRILRFTDGATCEVAGTGALRWLAGVAPGRPSASAWLEARAWRQVAAVILLSSALVGAYVVLTPWLAAVVAARLPRAVASSIGQRTLVSLDALVFQPSTLPPARQAGILRAFWNVRWPDDGDRFDLVLTFRHSDRLGANAFALPDGTIVITDALVDLARSDAELLGVLAHEVGHVDGRHGLRGLLQQSVVAMVVTWSLGDVSAVMASVPMMLLDARYSRAFEREADAYAVRVLRDNGIPPGAFADLLERLQAGRDRADAAAPPAYLSTHPATADRIEAIRGS
ncbi:MAG: M48 family metallopeptidase [Vicinamibacterales bacterium]